MDFVAQNIVEIEEKIQRACEKSGRKREDVLLIAVSKTKPVELIQQAVDCGLTTLGENKVQEIMEKYDHLAGVHWHLIGHLQTNKVKYIIDKVDLIHSVDSYKLAVEIDKRAAAKNKVMDILIEVNVAEEESKFGVKLQELEAFIRQVAELVHIRVRGMMTVAPFVENPEENREIFCQMQQIFIDINAKNIDNIYMDMLSMGMTGDYEVAIEEGATMVRVGTGIFGQRAYGTVDNISTN